MSREYDHRGLADGMEENYPVEFVFKEDGVHYTTIDHAWPYRLKYASFLDGIAIGKAGHPKLHLTLHQNRRDERVKKALERRGWTVDRHPYKPSGRKGITKKRKLEIADKTEVALHRLGYRKHA